MVIPVRVEDVVPNEDFSYELVTRQWVDLFADWKFAIGQLSRQIDHVIPKVMPDAPKPAPPEPPIAAAPISREMPAAAKPAPMLKETPMADAPRVPLKAIAVFVFLLGGGLLLFLWHGQNASPPLSETPAPAAPTTAAPQDAVTTPSAPLRQALNCASNAFTAKAVAPPAAKAEAAPQSLNPQVQQAVDAAHAAAKDAHDKAAEAEAVKSKAVAASILAMTVRRVTAS